VPIEFEDVREALKLWLHGRGAARVPAAPAARPPAPLEASTMQRWWRGLLERAGVSAVPDARATALGARPALAQTGNLELVRQLARHESNRTTQEYLHPSDADLRAAMRASAGKE
jgi:hypothetical protein